MSWLVKPKLVRQSACTYDDILDHLYNRLNEQQTEETPLKQKEPSPNKKGGTNESFKYSKSPRLTP